MEIVTFDSESKAQQLEFKPYKLNTLLFFICLILITDSVSAQWTQKGIDLDGEAAGDQSGSSVYMPDANTVAIGAYYNDGNGSKAGHVRIYHWFGNGWIQKGMDIDGEAANDISGFSLNMPNSNTVAVGATGNDGNGINFGHVRIYQWTGSVWTQKGSDIDGEAAADQSGYSVSMPDSNTIAMATPFNDGNGSNAGHVRIYQWSGNAWIQKGSDIDGVAAQDRSGYSVSMPDSNTVAIGAIRNDGNNGSSSGHVRIFKWSGTTWIQKGMDIDGKAAGDQSGFSVIMPDSNTIAIGAPFNDGNGTDAGHVRIFQWLGNAWIQKGNDIDGEASNNLSGWSVNMPDSKTVAIGARLNFDSGNNAGHVRIYQWSGTAWIQKGIDIDGEAAGDQSGLSVSMPDSNTVAIGASYNDGNGTFSGHVRVYSFVNISTNLKEAASLSKDFNLYPNPTNNSFYFEVDRLEKNEALLVYDVKGKLMLQKKLSQLKEKIETEHWQAGIYFVRYNNQTKKLVLLK